MKDAGSWIKGGGQLESLEKKKGGERCDKKSIKEKDTVMRGEMGIEEKYQRKDYVQFTKVEIKERHFSLC